MDFAALQQKLFDLDPSDRAEDLRKLTESVGNTQESAPITESLVQESVEVQQGTMPVEGDYSLSDFAALAGVTLNESQKTGSAGQLKGKDPMPKAKARGKHPHVDKLVGEADDDPKGFADYAKRGWDKYNTPGAVGIENPLKKLITPGSKKTKPDAKDKATSNPAQAKGNANNWKSFLQQHSSGLQAIAADPKKRKRFDTWMSKWNEAVEEETKSDKNKRHHKDLDDLERKIRKSSGGMDKDTQSHIDKRRKELTLNNEESKGLYYNVNKRKKAGTSRKQGHSKAPTAQAWKDAAKTAKKESVESIKDMLYRKLNDKK